VNSLAAQSRYYYISCAKKKKKRKGELKYPISLELLPMCVIVGVSLQPSESSAARENVISFSYPQVSFKSKKMLLIVQEVLKINPSPPPSEIEKKKKMKREKTKQLSILFSSFVHFFFGCCPVGFDLAAASSAT
jgi:hypothetical protein